MNKSIGMASAEPSVYADPRYREAVEAILGLEVERDQLGGEGAAGHGRLRATDRALALRRKALDRLERTLSHEIMATGEVRCRHRKHAAAILTAMRGLAEALEAEALFRRELDSRGIRHGLPVLQCADFGEVHDEASALPTFTRQLITYCDEMA